jgi:hypothetical protein
VQKSPEEIPGLVFEIVADCFSLKQSPKPTLPVSEQQMESLKGAHLRQLQEEEVEFAKQWNLGHTTCTFRINGDLCKFVREGEWRLILGVTTLTSGPDRILQLQRANRLVRELQEEVESVRVAAG